MTEEGASDYHDDSKIVETTISHNGGGGYKN